MDSLSVQVPDDEALLGRMMADVTRSDELYQPTNYWAYYEHYLLPELKQHGLRDFRRRRGSVLSSFGGTDLRPRGVLEVAPSVPGSRRIAAVLNRAIAVLPWITLAVWGSQPGWDTKYFHRYVKRKFDALGLALDRCGTSALGNPEDTVEIDGALWSLMHLQYCSMLVDALGHFSLDEEAVVCELGAGLGRNVEALAHLFPRATVLLFDIPPQLYVANQYLTSVFRERAVGYDEAVALEPGCTLPDAVRGKIVMLPNWRLPDWSRVGIELFWNSASFQEMEPEVVANYLKLVGRMSPHWVYINAKPEGNYWGEWKPGRGGTKAPVRAHYYSEGLGSAYELQTSYPTDYFLRDQDYTSYIFSRVSGL
jgi:putative sugar O-methyltransferase